MPSFTRTLAVYIAPGMTAARRLHAQQDAEASGRFLPIAGVHPAGARDCNRCEAAKFERRMKNLFWMIALE